MKHSNIDETSKYMKTDISFRIFLIMFIIVIVVGNLGVFTILFFLNGYQYL